VKAEPRYVYMTHDGFIDWDSVRTSRDACEAYAREWYGEEPPGNTYEFSAVLKEKTKRKLPALLLAEPKT
jgi:hypothetical protein